MQLSTTISRTSWSSQIETLYLLCSSSFHPPSLLLAIGNHSSTFHYQAFCAWEHSTSALCLEVISNSGIAPQKGHRKMEKHGSNRLPNRHMFAVCSWDKAEHCVVWSQLGTCVSEDSNFLPFCTCAWMPTKAPWVLVLGLKITSASR